MNNRIISRRRRIRKRKVIFRLQSLFLLTLSRQKGEVEVCFLNRKLRKTLDFKTTAEGRFFEVCILKISAGQGNCLFAWQAEKFKESMKIRKIESKLFSLTASFLLTTAAAFGANQFEGYAPTVKAGDGDTRGVVSKFSGK